MNAAIPRLGDLELAVLEDVWQAGAVDAKSVHGRVGACRAISLNTVQSTLERLHRKGLLSRQKVSHAYQYESRVGRQELVGRLIESTVGRISGMQQDVLLSAFVEVASRAGEDRLRQLEELVAARRAALQGRRE